jgi:hypothetical protein
MQSNTEVLLCSQASRGPAKSAHSFSAMPCPHMPSQASPMRASSLFPNSSQSQLKSSVPRHAKPYQGTNVLPSVARASQACTDLQCQVLPSHAIDAKPGFASACLATLFHFEPDTAKVIRAKACKAIPRYRCVAKLRKGQPSLYRFSVPWPALTCQARLRQRVPFHTLPTRAQYIRNHLFQGRQSNTKVLLCS